MVGAHPAPLLCPRCLPPSPRGRGLPPYAVYLHLHLYLHLYLCARVVALAVTNWLLLAVTCVSRLELCEQSGLPRQGVSNGLPATHPLAPLGGGVQEEVRVAVGQLPTTRPPSLSSTSCTTDRAPIRPPRPSPW